MKQLIIFLFFILSVFTSIAQSQPVYISEWVKKPTVEELKRPLIFIDFWATWCGPCISSMSHTQVLAEKFAGNVLFLYLSEEPSGKVQKFMKNRSKTFFSAVDNTGNNVKNFKITSIPHSILLDYQGKIIWQDKPTEMTAKTLKKIVNTYIGIVGNLSRLKEVHTEVKKLNWKTFTAKSTEIKYIESDEATNNYSVENDNEYKFSGDIKYLISIAFEVPTSQIVFASEIDKKYILSCTAKDFETFQKVLEKFLKKECSIDISREKKRETVYILKETKTSNFFTSKTYNFEKGDNVYLADEQSIMIDNATIEEMARDLSEFSEHTYIYKGKDEAKYDWNIHYKYNNFTLEQLASELDFEIKEKEVKLVYYYISNE